MSFFERADRISVVKYSLTTRFATHRVANPAAVALAAVTEKCSAVHMRSAHGRADSDHLRGITKMISQNNNGSAAP